MITDDLCFLQSIALEKSIYRYLSWEKLIELVKSLQEEIEDAYTVNHIGKLIAE